MPSTQISTLPSMALYPKAAWRTHMMPEEWSACLDAWIALAEAHLSLSDSDFTQLSLQDQSLISFLLSYSRETAWSSDSSFSDLAVKTKKLWKNAFYLSLRMLEAKNPPAELLVWEFLADFSKAYGKKHTWNLIAIVWKRSSDSLESSLEAERNFLIKNLDSGLHGDLKSLENHLKRLNHLLHCSPDTAAFLMAGSDFLDGLISCYKLMNPPLRKAIISTAYLSILGLTEGAKPKFSLLTDQLYALKVAADAHKAGPTNVNDSLVAELVTITPILRQLKERIESSGTGSSRAKSVLADLETFKKAGGGRPKKLVRRKVNKGKAVARGSSEDDDLGHGASSEVHIHQMSLITQVQDLFPDLGSGFVAKLLDEYKEDVEQVISHLLEDSLPAHLKDADRSEDLGPTHQTQDNYVPELIPRSTPPLLPTRRNVFDNDEFDQLAVDTSRLHFGKRNPDQTADDVLQDRTTAPNKAAILSALAVFDSDDDERDDTYDIEDVGGTVDSATPGNNAEEREADVRDANEESLFRAFKMSPGAFERDAATRRGKARTALREETKMTDEAIEGWALMLSRDPRRMKRLEMKFSTFTGAQKELAPTSWRASPAGSGTEDSDMDGGNRGRGGHRGRGGRGGGRGRDGGRGRGGSVAGPTGEKATEVARQRKEANKGSSANHNRRDQRAKKMARGGFPG